MFARIAKVFGYVKAPKATFMLLHPVKGTKALVDSKGIRGLATTRAGATLAGMVAVPVGLVAYTRRRNGR
jgi:hypothetical protein